MIFCGASSWFHVQFIPLGLQAEQVLKIAVCKPCEIHTIHTLKSELCSSASCVAQHMLGLFLSKDEAAEWGEGGSQDSHWPPLLKDGSLILPLPKPLPAKSHLLIFINYVVSALVFFWTSTRWWSSLIEQKNQTCKNTNQRVFCCTVGSGL